MRGLPDRAPTGRRQHRLGDTRVAARVRGSQRSQGRPEIDQDAPGGGLPLARLPRCRVPRRGGALSDHGNGGAGRQFRADGRHRADRHRSDDRNREAHGQERADRCLLQPRHSFDAGAGQAARAIWWRQPAGTEQGAVRSQRPGPRAALRRAAQGRAEPARPDGRRRLGERRLSRRAL